MEVRLGLCPSAHTWVGDDLEILGVADEEISEVLAAARNNAEHLQSHRMAQEGLQVRGWAPNGGEPARKAVQRAIGIGARAKRVEQKWYERLQIVVGHAVSG